MSTKEYIVEIVFSRNEVALNSHLTYPLQAYHTSEWGVCYTKKYKTTDHKDVITLMLDIKIGKLIGTIVHIAHGTKILINSTTNRYNPIDIKDDDAAYPTDDGYVMEDYESSSDGIS